MSIHVLTHETSEEVIRQSANLGLINREVFKALLSVLILIVLSSLVIMNAYATESYELGWHWYQDPVQGLQAKKSNDQLYTIFQSLTASQQLTVLQHATNELKAKAVLSGKVEDIANYKRAQDMWVEKATQFSVGWEHMLLKHPELNYSLKYSNQNRLASVMLQHQHDEENTAINSIARKHGLIFFFRAGNEGDLLYANSLKLFAKEHHIAILPVSVDGKISQVFGKKERLDQGHQHATALSVSYFPALVLANPTTGGHQIISYGFMSRSQLAARFLQIASHWKPNF